MPPAQNLGRTPALSTLLARILDHLVTDLPDALGSSVLARGPHGVSVLAHHGDIETIVLGAQLHHDQGPLPDALAHQVPVISLNLLADDRWPELGDRILHDAPTALQATAWQIRGAATVPTACHDDLEIVLAVTLSRPASAATVTALIGYGPLIEAALIAASTDIRDALALADTRAVIEQAKGAVMGRLGCTAEQSFHVLRETSQHTNVKLRVLAAALLDHITQTTDHPTPHQPQFQPLDGDAPRAAQRLWTALEEIAHPHPDDAGVATR